MKYCLITAILILTFWSPVNILAQWSQVNGTTLHIRCLAASGSNIYAGSNNVIISTDNGMSWNNPYSGPRGSSTRALAIIDTFVFAGTDGAGIYRSSDSGYNWKVLNNGLKQGDLYVGNLAVIDTMLFAFSQFGGIARSIDYGESWIKSDSGLPPTGTVVVDSSVPVYSIVANNTGLLAGTYSGVYLSTNGGMIWTAMNNSLKNAIVTSIVRNGTIFYAGTRTSGVFRSSNEGVDWTQINGGIKDTLIQAITSHGTDLFAAFGLIGIFHSRDSGAHWTFISKDLPDSIIHALATNDKYLYAGTGSTGIWRRPLSDFDAVKQNTSTENGIIFHPNFPNPFSSQTTISFSADKREYIDLKIFDLLGKECSSLYSGEVEEGMHSFEWNASPFAPGTYFCILRLSGGETSILPMVLRP